MTPVSHTIPMWGTQESMKLGESNMSFIKAKDPDPGWATLNARATSDENSGMGAEPSQRVW